MSLHSKHNFVQNKKQNCPFGSHPTDWNQEKQDISGGEPSTSARVCIFHFGMEGGREGGTWEKMGGESGWEPEVHRERDRV